MTFDIWDNAYKQGITFRQPSPAFLSYAIEKLGDLPRTGLDIGCGAGELIDELECEGFSMTGIEPSREAVILANKLVSSPIIFSPFEEASFRTRFSLITANRVIAFIEDQKAFFKKIHRLLAKGGIALITTPIRQAGIEYSTSYEEISIDEDSLMKSFGSLKLLASFDEYGGKGNKDYISRTLILKK